MNTQNLSIWTICLYLLSMTTVYAHAQQEAKITSLIQQLEHTDVTVQKQARDALLEIGEPALPQLLKYALGEAYLKAMIKPLKYRVDPTRKTVTEKVSDEIRYGCARIIIEMGKTAVPALIEVWRGDEDFYPWNARVLLARMGKPALDAFIAALDDKNRIVRRRAIFSMDTMMAFSQHPRAPVTPYLTLAPRKDIVRGFIKALKDDDTQIHGWAVSSLSELGNSSPEAISALSECLDYGSPDFSPLACLTLLTDMGKAGQAAVNKALDAPQWSFRFGAAFTYAEQFAHAHNAPAIDAVPLPAPVVSILAEGLKKTDKSTQEFAKSYLLRLKESGIEEASKVYDKHFPPPPPPIPLSKFLRVVRNALAELVICGKVVNIKFVPRPDTGHPITTDVTLKILHQIKGNPSNTITFMTPGGVLPDGAVAKVKGAPVFKMGEKVIVFLTTKPGHPHGGLTPLKNAKLVVVNDQVAIPYVNLQFKIVTPGIGSVEQQDVRGVMLPINFVVKFAKAALIDAEAVLPIDRELNNLAKAATELERYGTKSNTLLPENDLLNRLEAQLDAILEGQNPNQTKVPNEPKKEIGASQ